MRQAILILSLIGLVGCSNPYSPTQRAVGGGLIGGAGGAAIGGLAGGERVLSLAADWVLGGAVAGAATTPQPTYRSYSSGGGGGYY